MSLSNILSMMIVDDSMIIRNRIARLVAGPALPHINIAGLAANGEMAVELARDCRPDLITMDLTMPLLDGEACIEQIIDFLPETKILVVSALADKATALRAIKKGASGFLHKPFTDDELLESLLELID
ncbi:response regulator receiver protein [Dechloromonas denitrificans]|uniref:Response regulator receiver protein n=1 Tax=Dechloromonas denitrificans TaxID=281362 RepID=A0A133XEZ6_9RHOO|nr:response regulator [Dechloromonas denitrificans]KXB29515.1 response regulator receiver protein [Dechloromonas denitrificans]